MKTFLVNFAVGGGFVLLLALVIRPSLADCLLLLGLVLLDGLMLWAVNCRHSKKGSHSK